MDMNYEITFGGGKKVDAQVRGFTVSTDQPIADGGHNSAPSPFELFLASIGACAGFYVLSFCQARAIPTAGIKLMQTIHRNDTTHMVDRIDIDIALPADFPEKYKGAVIKAAESCTVKKHLATPPVIRINTRQ
jgi:ribosomal protein S12 methylthiotransferase accessory factor